MENKKPAPHNPIITFDEGRDQELLAISKSAEDKLYMLMFFNPSIEGTELIQFIGRTNCYFGIKGICENYDIDPKDITVLVEYVVRNRNTNEYEYAIMHPDNKECKNAYQFCKSVQDLFGDNAYDIDQYTDDREGEYDPYKGTTDDTSPTFNSEKIDVSVFEGSAEMANMYADIVAEKDATRYSPANLFQAPKENPFDKSGKKET